MLKPFLVSFEFEYACLAENEEEAKTFLQHALSTDVSSRTDDCSVVPLEPGLYPSGWNKYSLLYSD